MKNKLLYLTEVSLKRKIKSKWFIIANLILALLIISICNIDTIITKFGGDFNQKTVLHVIDNIGAYDLFLQSMEAANISFYKDSELDYIIDKTDITIDEAYSKIKEEDSNDIYIELNNDETNYLSITLLSKDYIDLLDYSVLNSAINSTKAIIAINALSITEEEYQSIYKEVSINRLSINEEVMDANESTETLMTTVFPIVILPFFMLVVYLIQMIGAEVNDEKSTKGMEIIISNVSPTVHFTSKILSGNLFVITQGILLIAYLVLGILIRYMTVGLSFDSIPSEMTGIISSIKETSIYTNFGPILLVVLILMLLTFVSYSLLAGILASMTTNTEDFQQLQTPLIVVLLIAYYLAIMAGMFNGSILIRILSYIPLISAILSPSLLVLGQIGIIDYIISCILVILFNYILVKYGLRIYKVGILNYSSSDLWKKMFKAMKG
ncbi:MAG: ABC transporter permease [Bacilli bacterium]|nr:ABC transporter permease [Bacilli bacterium]